jgi:hypothetical protein
VHVYEDIATCVDVKICASQLRMAMSHCQTAVCVFGNMGSDFKMRFIYEHY